MPTTYSPNETFAPFSCFFWLQPVRCVRGLIAFNSHFTGIVKKQKMITIRASDPCADSKAHLLPCEIQATGSALVSAYFKPEAGPKSQEATFRGRQLRGVDLPMPAGYSGAMIADTLSADVADGEERRWMHKGTVASFTYWKHDELPHDEEPVLKAMQWAALCDVLHDDHAEDESEPIVVDQ